MSRGLLLGRLALEADGPVPGDRRRRLRAPFARHLRFRSRAGRPCYPRDRGTYCAAHRSLHPHLATTSARQERAALIDAFVKEEVFYREGRKLGLDRDDTVVRRRFQQKMEFLLEPPASDLETDDATLGAWLEANRAAFRTAPRLAFSQVFVDPARRPR